MICLHFSNRSFIKMENNLTSDDVDISDEDVFKEGEVIKPDALKPWVMTKNEEEILSPYPSWSRCFREGVYEEILKSVINRDNKSLNMSSVYLRSKDELLLFWLKRYGFCKNNKNFGEFYYYFYEEEEDYMVSIPSETISLFGRATGNGSLPRYKMGNTNLLLDWVASFNDMKTFKLPESYDAEENKENNIIMRYHNIKFCFKKIREGQLYHFLIWLEMIKIELRSGNTNLIHKLKTFILSES